VRQAARIQLSFEMNDKLGKGSYSLDGKMIDAPVYKQVSTAISALTGRRLSADV
jgi:citrate lyase subunit beta-like protein